jgi:hypothetical protein
LDWSEERKAATKTQTASCCRWQDRLTIGNRRFQRPPDADIHTQLLTEGKDLEAKVVAGTEESAEAGEEAEEKWNQGTGFIA